MELRNRPPATLMALLLLAVSLGCRHKSAPPSASTSQVSDVPTGQKAPAPQVSSAPGGLIPLRLHLADAISKIDGIAQKSGFAGWPGVPTLDGLDKPDASLEDRMFRNDRAILLQNLKTKQVSALVLMPVQSAKGWAIEHYRLMRARDLFGQPTLEPVSLGSSDSEDFGINDVIFWEQGETSTKKQEESPRPELRLYPDELFVFGIGPSESDNIATFLAGDNAWLPVMIDEISDAKGDLEGIHDPADAEFLQTLSRTDFTTAVKQGSSKRYVWFAANGKKYAAQKANWDEWQKGPRPSVVKDSNP